MNSSAPVVRVPTGLHLQSRFFAATSGLWRRLAGLETAALSELVESTAIEQPIYVASLARSGTTIVTEMLERHPAVTSHRYSDFPNVWTPYWRNYLLQRTRRGEPRTVERAHQDRIEVSNDSPEAVEEVLWMHFFPRRHDPAVVQVLDGAQRNPDFDSFYADHIRKLLAVRGARRYLAKGNYNIARMRYIRSLFPDARFLVPVRDPVPHVASLAKQHALFTLSSHADPRVARQLALSGHFEFGPGRRVPNYGDDGAVRAIDAAWKAGREAEGWARLWAATYGQLLGQLDSDPELAQAVMLFRYEDLCSNSLAVIDRILGHCDLDRQAFAELRARYADKLSLPDYYRASFDESERSVIENTCDDLHRQLLARCVPGPEPATGEAEKTV